MKLEFEVINNCLLIRIDGDIDHHTCEVIRDKIDDEIMRKNPKNIIFDMRNVGFMDSSGIGVIIGRFKQITIGGGTTAMINIKPQIKRIYDICGLSRIIKSYPNLDAAVKSIS